MQDLHALQITIEKEIANTNTLDQLEEIRLRVLGKKGVLTEQLKSLGAMPEEQRREMGQQVNLIKEKIQSSLALQKEDLQQRLVDAALEKEKVDITLPARGQTQGNLHPITQTIRRVEQYFISCGFSIETGPEIETEYYNFEALNTPDNHPARALHDTFYFPDGRLLRSHTSPVQIHALESRGAPLRVIAPGRVYRCDSDVTHTPMFHQVEGLMLDEGITFGDLKGLLQDFLAFFFDKENLGVRFRASYFPFTEPSAEVDIQCVKCEGKGCRICKQTGWLEILGCGMVHPNVLLQANISPDKFQGFAFGMGMERLAMLRYSVGDIRWYFENDLRFLSQF